MNYRIYFWIFLISVLDKCIQLVNSKKYQGKEKKLTDNIVGVHFGHEFIRYAITNGDSISILTNDRGVTKTPILINFNNNGKILIGESAQYYNNQTLFLSNLQKIIGRTFQEIKTMPGFPFQYNIIDRYNKPYLYIEYSNGSYTMTVEEILSFLFVEIKQNSETYLNGNVSQIVLSVPDNFDDNQQLALKAAANKGGLEVVKSVTDSVAAIYGYELEEIDSIKNMLVINIDKHSLTMVVNAVENNNIESLGRKVCDKFGEFLFDEVLVEYLKTQYESVTGKQLINYDVLKQLRGVSVKLRERLTVLHSIEFSWRSVNVDFVASVRISRAKYDELIYHHLKKLLNNVTELLLELEMKRSDISEVILLGDVFKTQRLQKEIRNYFYGLELRVEKDFNEIIVEGAAYIASKSQEISSFSNIVLVDVLTANIGVEIFNGYFHLIVPRGSPVPVKMSRNLTVTFTNQSRVNIKVLEGDRPSARSNSFLGEMNFHRVSAGLRTFVIFNLEFDIHRHGVIIFTATDVAANYRKSMLIKRNYGIYNERNHSPDRDEKSAERDYKIGIISDQRTKVESIVHEIKSHMTVDSDMINVIKRSSIDYIILEQTVQETILWLEKYLSSEIDEMEELKIKFESTVKPLLARAYWK